MSLDCGNERQWPADPYSLAKRLWEEPIRGPCLEVLRKFDQGLPPGALTLRDDCQPKEYISCQRLKTLAIVFIFSEWAAPIEIFEKLGRLPDNDLGAVSYFVKKELTLHFSMPLCIGKITHCLRPDLVNIALKVWKHSKYLSEIEPALKKISTSQWLFHPYCPLGARMIQILHWVGAAMMPTGRSRDSDIIIGQTFIICTEKDRVIAALILLFCSQKNNSIAFFIKNGPPVFHPILSIKGIF